MATDRNRLRNLDRMLTALKSTPRTGWMLRGVHAALAESIAEHMAESAVLALLIAEFLRKKGVNVNVFRAAAISAVHDLSEAVIGDIVKMTADAIGKERKEHLELTVARDMVGEDSIVYDLIYEYIEQKTIESQVAKLAETLSTLLQSLRYISQGYRDVAEIACSSAHSIDRMLQDSKDIAELKEILDEFVRAGKEACKALTS
ncbi:HD family hydrolase [Pyrodictium abyssi]|uniref:HD family hydrolase n=1 Tax=Pyrodictium abyssi TaxID=54256 RepID=A0ABM8IWX4_9CREN|nr:HD family hydrolase [Pyrodictium abyssi]